MAKSPGLRQIAYISNRPAVLAETLTYVRHFLPWITQAVVLTPQVDAVKRAVDGLDLDVVVVADGEVATGIPQQHSARNAHLQRRSTPAARSTTSSCRATTTTGRSVPSRSRTSSTADGSSATASTTSRSGGATRAPTTGCSTAATSPCRS